MKWSEKLEIKGRIQKEVYDDVLSDLLWHKEFHGKRMSQYATSDEALFIYHFEKHQAYKELVNTIKHFKF